MQTKFSKFAVLAALLIALTSLSALSAAEDPAAPAPKAKDTVDATFAGAAKSAPAGLNLHLAGPDSQAETYAITIKDDVSGSVVVTSKGTDTTVPFKIDSMAKDKVDGTLTYSVKFADGKTHSARAGKDGKIAFVDQPLGEVVPIPVTK